MAILLAADDRYDEPLHIRKQFDQETDWALASINLDLGELLARASSLG